MSALKAYALFSSEIKDEYRSQIREGLFSEVAEQISSRWTLLTKEEKQKYYDLAEKDTKTKQLRSPRSNKDENLSSAGLRRKAARTAFLKEYTSN